MQETIPANAVQNLVQEDPTCCGATKPERHNDWALEPKLLGPRTMTIEGCTPGNPYSTTWEATVMSKKPAHHNQRLTPACCNSRKARAATKTQHNRKKRTGLWEVREHVGIRPLVRGQPGCEPRAAQLQSQATQLPTWPIIARQGQGMALALPASPFSPVPVHSFSLWIEGTEMDEALRNPFQLSQDVGHHGPEVTEPLSLQNLCIPVKASYPQPCLDNFWRALPGREFQELLGSPLWLFWPAFFQHMLSRSKEGREAPLAGKPRGVGQIKEY